MKKQFSFFEAFDRKMSELLADANNAKSAPEPIAFTQAELQFLKSFLARELSHIEHCKSLHKDCIDIEWNRSEKDTEFGGIYFKQLNRQKEHLRSLKREQKKFVVIQQKIKGMLKTL